MNRIEAGTIVLLRFPFSDSVGYKRRPALVLKNWEDGDVLVCRITSKIYNSKYDIYLNDWVQYGLKLPSVLRLHKMETLETDMIEAIMGHIDDIVLSNIKIIYKSIIEECENNQ